MGAQGARTDLEPAVAEFVRRVKAAFRVERIILFGSRARGDYLVESDYDFLVVSDDFVGMPFPRRMSLLYEYWEAPAPLEVFCYTREEFQRKARQIGLVAEAVKEGVGV